MEASTSGSGSTKRKRDVLTIEKKVEIINELKKGVSASSLAVTHNLPRTTINDIKKKQDEILNFASQMEQLAGPVSKIRKTMKPASNELLDEAVWIWFVQKRNEGIPISGQMICDRALKNKTNN